VINLIISNLLLFITVYFSDKSPEILSCFDLRKPRNKKPSYFTGSHVVVGEINLFK